MRNLSIFTILGITSLTTYSIDSSDYYPVPGLTEGNVNKENKCINFEKYSVYYGGSYDEFLKLHTYKGKNCSLSNKLATLSISKEIYGQLSVGGMLQDYLVLTHLPKDNQNYQQVFPMFHVETGDRDFYPYAISWKGRFFWEEDGYFAYYEPVGIYVADEIYCNMEQVEHPSFKSWYENKSSKSMGVKRYLDFSGRSIMTPYDTDNYTLCYDLDDSKILLNP